MVNLSKNPANTPPTIEDMTAASVEDKYRSAVKFLVERGVIASDAVDSDRMQAAIAHDTAAELARDAQIEDADPELVAKVEYAHGCRLLGEAVDGLWDREMATVKDVHRGAFGGHHVKAFNAKPTATNMLQLQKKGGGLGVSVIESLNPDGSRSFDVLGTSTFVPDCDEWTNADYRVGQTDGEVQEQRFYKNGDGRTDWEKPQTRKLSGQDVADLAASLADYQLVEGGVMHREQPTG